MPVRIIDNKKIEMTNDEWDMYQNICRSYDRPNFKGEELFRGLFETDDDGIIVYLKPPSNRHTSMEVVIFMSFILQHQHIRLMHKKVDKVCADLTDKVNSLLKSKSD